MIKKRFNLVKIIFFCFLIAILLIPLALSAIDIVVSKDKVRITVLYEGNPSLGVRAANITDSTGNHVYYSYNRNPPDLLFDKTPPPASPNTTFTFYSSGWCVPHPCVNLDEGDYTFSIAVIDKSVYGGSTTSDSKDFKVDFTPCDHDNQIDKGEECDGNDLNRTTCEDLGFAGGGTLSCSDCNFNTSGCLSCNPDECDKCNNKVCTSDGREWTTTDYALRCGAEDSDLGGLGSTCTPGKCDLHADKYCDTNHFWTSPDFCTACSRKDSSCPGSCTPGACDIDTKKYCDNGAWVTPSSTEAYCYVCRNFDSECAGYYSCQGSNCDTKNNSYCQNGKWVSTNYCEHCGSEDSDCGIPICTHGTCDTCSDAKKYCNHGVWEVENYCDDNRCGSVDSYCNRTCKHGTCDHNAHKYCSYGLWVSDWETYCDKCKGLADDPYCINPLNCGNGNIDYMEACDGSNLNSATCLTWPQFVGGTLGCSEDCLSFDRTNCILSNESCGDGIIQGDDQCDGNALGGKTCTDPIFGFMGGELKCTDDCKYDTSECIPFPKCGDGVVNPDSEDCDGLDLRGQTCESLGYDGGVLKCDSNCEFDKSGCYASPPAKVCGDGIIQKPNDAGFDEDCDETNLSSTSCNGVDDYTSGVLTCKGDCTFDYSNCSGPRREFCGDDAAQQPNDDGFFEDCDGLDLRGQTCKSLGYDKGTLRCHRNCTFDKSGCVSESKVCGDGVVQRPNDAGINEDCDGSNLNNKQCSDFDDYTGGYLFCYGDCTYNYNNCTGGTFRCGDGVRNNMSEDCDGNDLAGWTCESLGYDGGVLKCDSNCEFDKSGCYASPPARVCGDGKVQHPNDAGFDEQCDNTNLEFNVCSDFDDYTGGVLGCKGDCSFDYSGCSGPARLVCGDDAAQQPNDDGFFEDCDENDLRGYTCEALGYDGGTLGCTDSCTFDKSGCVSESKVCGDGVVQRPNDAGFDEDCDESNLNNKQCSDFDDYTGGVLTCKGDCTFDYSNCTGDVSPVCDNGILEPGEQCDGGVGNATCESLGNNNFIGGTLKCSTNCEFNTSKCIINQTPARCGDGKVNGREGCDGTNLAGLTCAKFRDYTGGTLKCRQNCTLDFSGCTKGPGNISGHCNNNVTDGDETDLNCGGSCPPCAKDKTCKDDSDCISDYYCYLNVCKEASCFDNIRNGLETDVDCGGDCQRGCNVSQGCRPGFSDCLIGLFCNPSTKKCAVPTCNDGFKNGEETDTDCGDGCPEKCGMGGACISPNDCESGYCEEGVCSINSELDSDDDGMPDKWELAHGLDPNRNDADEDFDGDNHSNLDEYLDGTDPADPNNPLPEKKHTAQIILLVLGLLLVLGSAGFLVYSRKVLVSQQQRAAPGGQAVLRKPGVQRQPLIRGARTRIIPGVRRPISRAPLARRMTQRQAARTAFLRGFGKEGLRVRKEKRQRPLLEKQAPEKQEFVSLSKLRKEPGPGVVSGIKEAPKKPLGAAFEKLRELSDSYKNKKKRSKKK